MIVGHIGARAGSKGVAGKNFRMLQGKRLIEWSLDQLFDCKEIDVVVVSTDSPEIYQLAVDRGALDIGLRPDHLATDTAAKWHVWQHALEEVEKRVGPVDRFVDLDCTSPLRADEDITNALVLFEEQKPDMVMSCTQARKNPYFNLVETDETGALQVSKPLPNGVWARQDAPIVYEHVGLVYVLDPEYLRKAKTIYEGRVIPFEVPAERSLDIDSEFDWTVINLLMKERLKGG